MEKIKDIAAPQKKAYSGLSSRMSELSLKADTSSENLLQNLISSIRPSVSARYNERIPIESEREGSASAR